MRLRLTLLACWALAMASAACRNELDFGGGGSGGVPRPTGFPRPTPTPPPEPVNPPYTANAGTINDCYPLVSSSSRNRSRS